MGNGNHGKEKWYLHALIESVINKWDAFARYLSRVKWSFFPERFAIDHGCFGKVGYDGSTDEARLVVEIVASYGCGSDTIDVGIVHEDINGS